MSASEEGVVSSAPSLDSHRGTAPYSITTILFCFAAFWGLKLVYHVKTNKKKEILIMDMDAVTIKEFDQNTQHPSNDLQLSNKGKVLAQDEPYVIRDSQARILVIHTAEHVREFFRNDEKGKSLSSEALARLEFSSNVQTQEIPYLNTLLYTLYYMLRNLRNINRPRSEVSAIQRTEVFEIIRGHLDVEFSPERTLELIRWMSKEVDRWLTARWSVIYLANGNQRGNRSSEDEKGKVRQASQDLVCCVIGRSLYGDAIDDEKVLSKLLGFYSQYTKLAVRVFEPVGEKKKSLFSSIPRAADLKAEILLKEWETFNLNIFSSAQQHKLSCPIEKIFQTVKSKGEIAVIEFLYATLNILFTNIESTTKVLVFLLNSLDQDLSLRSLLSAEIKDEKACQSYDQPQYINSLNTVLQCFVLESLRLNPIAFFTPPSCTAIEKVIGRYRIPAGTPTIIDVHRLNRNPLTWGADGNQFRPERFREIGEIQRKYGFVKFGVGDGEGYLTGNMLETLLKCVAVGAAEIYEASSKN